MSVLHPDQKPDPVPAPKPAVPGPERLAFHVPAWARARARLQRTVGAVAADACSDPAGERALRALWNAWSAPAPREAVRTAVSAAAAAVALSPDEEPAWYALLRGLEMLGEHGPVRAGPLRHPSLLAAAVAQRQAFQASPRLATVRARLEGGVGAAREALRVNPAWAPAQVALGRALLGAGAQERGLAEARAVLEAVEAPERVQGGAVALARARAETGDPAQALLAVAREANAPGLSGHEPAIHDPLVAREAEEVRGLARLALGAHEAGARSLLRAAAEGSSTARQALAVHAGRREMRLALRRLARDGELPPAACALAAILAG